MNLHYWRSILEVKINRQVKTRLKISIYRARQNCKLDNLLWAGQNWKIGQNWTKLNQIEPNWTKLKIEQKWKLDKIEYWTKLKIEQNWRWDKIEDWTKLKIGQNWKSWHMVKEEGKNRSVEARSMLALKKIGMRLLEKFSNTVWLCLPSLVFSWFIVLPALETMIEDEWWCEPLPDADFWHFDDNRWSNCVIEKNNEVLGGVQLPNCRTQCEA